MPQPKTTSDISAIKGYIEKHDKQLIKEYLNGLDFIKDLASGVRRNVRTEVSLNKMTVGEGVRKLNTAIEEAKHKRTFTKRKLTPRHAMKIIDVDPEQQRETFMSEMMAPGATREPFAAWQWKQEFAKLASEINDNFYDSEYVADPEDYDAGTAYVAANKDTVYFDHGDKRGPIVYLCIADAAAGESPATDPAKWQDIDASCIFDGLGTIIANEITATNLAAVATGAYDDTSAYGAFIQTWNALPEAHKNLRPTCYASFDAVQDLVTDINKTFGSGQGIGNADIEEGKEFILKQTGGRLKIKPCTWMKDSRRIIITPPKNLITGMDQVSDVNKVSKTIETLHGYKSVVKYMLTFQVADLAVLYVNNQP